MKPFTRHRGIVLPLDRANVDTDAILPKAFLKSVERSGFGVNLFDDWRYLDPHDEGENAPPRRPNPQFVLNQPRYVGASILLARENFGCGSSREHAPWALLDYGFRVLIAPSYADIFFDNCFKNGILPLCLDAAIVDRLFAELAGEPGYALDVDLERQCVTTPSGQEIAFAVDPFRKDCLLQGLDEVGLTLRFRDEIAAFEARRWHAFPWLAPAGRKF